MALFSLPHMAATYSSKGEDPEKEEHGYEKKLKILVDYGSEESEDVSGDESGKQDDEEWRSEWSLDQNAWYYYSTKTGKTTWELPKGANINGASTSDENEVLRKASEEGSKFVEPYIVDPLSVTVAGCTKLEAINAMKQCGEIVAVYQHNPSQQERPINRKWCIRFAEEASASLGMKLHGTSNNSGKYFEVSRTKRKNFSHEEQANKVFLRNLPLSVTNNDIEQFLGVAVLHVYRIRKQQNNNSFSSKKNINETNNNVSDMAVVTLMSAQSVQDVIRCQNKQTITASESGERGIVLIQVSKKRIWEGVSSTEKVVDEYVSSSSSLKPSLTVWVGGLRRDCEEDQTRTLLAQQGVLKSFRFIKDKFEGDCKGFCFAEYESMEGSQAAVLLNGQFRLGSKLRVRYAVDRPSS